MSAIVQPGERSQVRRTPDERFAGLPGFAYEPRYREWNGIRLAHVDEGDGPPVVMLHGEPSWSYLYRKVIPPLVDAGFRCIAADLPGFGRSDKPTDEGWYTYARHTEAIATLLDELDLHDVCLVMHDWGGPIGLRVAMLEAPARVSRMVVMDAGVLTGEQEMGPTWRSFRDLVASTPDLPIGRVVRLGCRRKPPADVLSAYDAPFPDSESKAGVRAFPRIVPLGPDDPGARAGRATLEALREDRRPALLLWADSDPMFPLDSFASEMHAQFGQRSELEVVGDAGHFLQEDHGEWIGERIATWLGAQRAAERAPATKPERRTQDTRRVGAEVSRTPPASHATMSFERTIERGKIHKRSLDEVFVTDIMLEGEQPGAIAALLPRSHSLYCELSDGHHDLLLLLETGRQSMTLFAHRGLEVPPGTAFVMTGLDAEIVDLDATRRGAAPSQMTFHVPIGEANYKRGRLRSYTMYGDCYIDGRLAMVSTGSGILIPSALYERARRVSVDPADVAEAAEAPRPVAPERVGRHDPRNVVVSEPRTLEGRVETSVIVDLGHSSFFDHELDHVPGMLMLEAARQTAMLAVADGGWAPHETVPDRCEGRLTRYAALAPPAVCRAETEAVDDADGLPARTIRVAFSQQGQELGYVTMRLRRLDATAS